MSMRSGVLGTFGLVLAEDALISEVLEWAGLFELDSRLWCLVIEGIRAFCW